MCLSRRHWVHVSMPHVSFVLNINGVKACKWVPRDVSMYTAVGRYNTDVSSRRCAGWRCACTREVAWVLWDRSLCQGGRRFFFFGSLPGAVTSRHVRLNCRRFLAKQCFWKGAVCRWTFVSRVPCASTVLVSQIVCVCVCFL